MRAKHRSAEEWIAEVNSIVDHYRNSPRGAPQLTRKQAIDRLVDLGLSEGDAVRYLDKNRVKPAVSHL
jgi:uncharacterized protein YjiS (DUF1127 family)